jgi:predicted anti-sigma-YlaC factor YlaD
MPMIPAKFFFLIFTFTIFLSNCSSKRIEQNFIDSLAGKFSSNQSNVIRGEEDPELLGDSMPFMLKMLEIMSESSPENVNIKTSLAQGFTAYGSLWLENEALINEDDHYEYSEHLKNRAKQLFYRAWHYGFQGLNMQYPGFSEKIKNDLSVLTIMNKSDVPLLTWTGLAMVSWIKHSSDSADAVSELPKAVSMINKAFDLDPEYGEGVLYEFFIYYDSEQINSTGKKKQLVDYRDKIISDSDNNKCSPYLTWASAISIKTQNKSEFIKMLAEGLKIDVDKRPEYRLSNKICQKMSKWYLTKIDDFFL